MDLAASWMLGASLALALCAQQAGAAEPARPSGPPVLWGRLFSAAAFNPGGAMAEVASEVRLPVLRYGGVAFNGTFVGGGARVALSPAYLDTALRVSVQPIDLLPVTVELVRTTYWESPWGLVPVDETVGNARPARKPLYQADRDFAGTAWTLVLSPTLQLRAGPIVAFSNVSYSSIRVRPERGPEPWVFEPYRGLAMAYDDRLVEHTSALLWERLDGEDAPILRLGAVLRGKLALTSKDEALAGGALVQWRPGPSTDAPTFLLLVTPYLREPDFMGPIPYVALAVTIERERPLVRRR